MPRALTKPREGAAKPLGLAGKVVGSLFFGIFLGMGLLFVGLMLRDVYRSAVTYVWSETSCEILASSAGQDPQDRGRESAYVFRVKYRYSFRGKGYTSEVYARSYRGSSDYGEAQRLAARYPPKAQAVCYVNPSKPAEAVLGRGSLWVCLFLPIPLIFVAVGGGGIYVIWRGPRPSAANSPSAKEAISAHARKLGGPWPGLVLWTALLLVGSALTIVFLVRPALRVQQAKRWQTVPCVIVSSRVRTHRGSESTTYSVDILYSYKVGGREYKANRYGFLGGSSSGRRKKSKIVARHPAGSKAVCYVNPLDPTDAVLNRDFPLVCLFGLIPLVIALVGAGGLAYALPRALGRGKGSARSEWLAQAEEPASRYAAPGARAFAGPVKLKPKYSPLKKLFAAMAFALLWNGVVSIFVFEVIKGWRRGRPDWVMAVFVSPFVLIGLVTVVVAVYFMLSLLNSRCTLTASSGEFPLGASFRLRWILAGGFVRVRRIEIRLEGREEVTFRRGKNTVTDKKVFAALPLVDETDRYRMFMGEVEVTVPADTMHSFEAKHNKIIWAFQVHAEIGLWPDVRSEFPIVVTPGRTR